MLGSVGEADDAVQEARLRLSRADASSVENLGGWLTRRSRLGDRADGVLPDDDPLIRREPHRIAQLDAKGGEERVGVA